MTDRRRINGPPSGTAAPAFAPAAAEQAVQPAKRVRKPNELRRIFLKTGLVPSAAGSAYLELEASTSTDRKTFIANSSSLKLTCSVHGPKPVPRTSSFSPNLLLSANVKFAPFATRLRRGYIRDTAERDLSVHLETALRGAIIPDRWPKSAVDVIVTVLEGEEDGPSSSLMESQGGIEGVGLMNVLAGCLTVASAALADAKVDGLDLLAGGVAAIVSDPGQKHTTVLDPCAAEDEQLESVCVVGYLPNRDEVTELWVKGDLTTGDAPSSLGFNDLLESAVNAAKGVQTVLQEAARESAERHVQQLKGSEAAKPPSTTSTHEVEMKT